MPKEGASYPDTALPVGYVRTFLPFPRSLSLSLLPLVLPLPLRICVSLSHSFGRLPFGKLPQCTVFFPRPLTRGVCVCMLFEK